MASKKATAPDPALDAQLFAMLMTVGGTEEATPAPRKPAEPPRPTGWGSKPTSK